MAAGAPRSAKVAAGQPAPKVAAKDNGPCPAWCLALLATPALPSIPFIPGCSGCGPELRDVPVIGGPLGTAQDFLGRLPRYLELAAGGAVMLAGLVVILAAVSGAQDLALSAATKGLVSPPQRAAAPSRVPVRPEVAERAERLAEARVGAAEGLARRRKEDARRARAERKLTEGFLPKEERRRVGGADVESGRTRGTVRPIGNRARA